MATVNRIRNQVITDEVYVKVLDTGATTGASASDTVSASDTMFSSGDLDFSNSLNIDSFPNGSYLAFVIATKHENLSGIFYNFQDRLSGAQSSEILSATFIKNPTPVTINGETYYIYYQKQNYYFYTATIDKNSDGTAKFFRLRIVAPLEITEDDPMGTATENVVELLVTEKRFFVSVLNTVDTATIDDTYLQNAFTTDPSGVEGIGEEFIYPVLGSGRRRLYFASPYNTITRIMIGSSTINADLLDFQVTLEGDPYYVYASTSNRYRVSTSDLTNEFPIRMFRVAQLQSGDGGSTTVPIVPVVPANQIGLYCTPADLQDELQLTEPFTSTTTPNENTILNWINSAQTEIDRETNSSWGIRSRSETFGVYNQWYRRGSGLRFKLLQRNIRQLDSSEGDILELWEDDSYTNYLADKTEGRNDDYWLDYQEGILFIRKFYWYALDKPIRMTYRFGLDDVPDDIREATIKMVAIRYLLNFNENFSLTQPDNVSISFTERIKMYKDDVKALIKDRAEVYVI